MSDRGILHNLQANFNQNTTYMKRKILLSATLLSSVIFSQAQDANRTFAITGQANNKFLWADIKEVDIATGKILGSLFESEKTTYKISMQDANEKISEQELKPTSFGVAAAAYDARTNRLFFAPMHISDIRFLDLNKRSPEFTIVKRNVIAAPANRPYQPEENHITRMVIAADGYGYAITNDGNHFIRFTTGRKPVVEDLGPLVDAESNKGISIHNKCTSWGGDIVADALGKLVIVSASHNVFSIDINTRVVTHTGTITGLTPNFTTNGAVVDADGALVVSSANVFEGLYKVNMTDLKATPIAASDKSFNASDLANANMLNQKKADDQIKFDLSNSKLPAFEIIGDTRVFPNPITNEQFNISFEGMKAGNYTIQFSDLAGRALQQKSVTITGKQVESFKLNSKIAKGMYLVKVLDANRQIAISQRVVLQ
ncbi:MAG: hypothetical protein RLY16_870 [Bacteroidota bacterium]